MILSYAWIWRVDWHLSAYYSHLLGSDLALHAFFETIANQMRQYRWNKLNWKVRVAHFIIPGEKCEFVVSFEFTWLLCWPAFGHKATTLLSVFFSEEMNSNVMSTSERTQTNTARARREAGNRTNGNIETMATRLQRHYFYFILRAHMWNKYM